MHLACLLLPCILLSPHSSAYSTTSSSSPLPSPASASFSAEPISSFQLSSTADSSHCPYSSIFTRRPHDGSLIFPQNPFYYGRLSCSWDIDIANLTLGLLIKFQWADIGTGVAPNGCYGDFILVALRNGTLLQRFCGAISGSAMFPYPSLTLLFNSFGVYNGRGFSLTFSAAPIRDPSIVVRNGIGGSLRFPSIGLYYGNSSSYLWSIVSNSATTGMEMDIITQSSENCSSCLCASLTVQESPEAPERRYCGSGRITSTIFPYHSAMIRFDSGSNLTGFAFSLDYHFITATGKCEATHLATADGGLLLFPGSGEYYDGALCWWRTNMTASKVIEIELHQKDIEQCDSCSCDSLCILPAGGEVEKHICGKSRWPELFVFNTSSLLFAFFSDSAVGGKGFFLSYRFTTTEFSCAKAHRRTPTGGSISLTYQPAPNDLRREDRVFCAWLISSEHSNEGIHMSLNRMDLRNCVTVRRTDGKILRNFCSWQFQNTSFLETALLLTYVVDREVFFNGFDLSYSFVMLRPGYPSTYAESLNVLVMGVSIPAVAICICILFLGVQYFMRKRTNRDFGTYQDGSAAESRHIELSAMPSSSTASNSAQIIIQEYYDDLPSYEDAIKASNFIRACHHNHHRFRQSSC